MKRYEISNCEWERIKDQLPAERTGKRGRPAKNNRIMLNGMLWIARTGAQWREIPECYGPWQSVYARFRKWQKDGVWEEIFHTLSSDADIENLSIDSTMAKAHQSTNGGFKKVALKRGRKIHWKNTWRVKHKAPCNCRRSWKSYRISNQCRK